LVASVIAVSSRKAARMSSTPLPPLRPDTTGREPAERARRRPLSGRDARGGPRRRSVAALLAITAVVGGATGAGIVSLAPGDASTVERTTLVESARIPVADDATGGADVAAVVAAAGPSVVEIAAEGVASDVATDPFGRGGAQSASTGSGFVADAQGLIVTAAHVVDGASSIEVTFSDGTTRAATLLGQDDGTDVAVLRADVSGLTVAPAEIASSSDLALGDELIVIGSPFGYEGSVSTGVVSGLGRTVEAPNGFTVAGAIQTDAAMNPGNSGGPVFDALGRVVGMADQIATDGSSAQSSGVGFAIPSDVIAQDVQTLAAGEAVAHPYLGVATTEGSGERGALVASVTAGAPADAAGLETGDLVTAIDGADIAGSDDLVAAIAAAGVGDEIVLTVTRDGEELSLAATLGTQPAAGAAGG
jgi:putative serine protease PepD